jgi:murein DD-endopeptidase MepM/ murein hydrolase activator NlpD
MPAGQHVGTAYVDLLPDAGRFLPELRREVGRAADRSPAEVKVDADTRGMGRTMQRAGKEHGKQYGGGFGVSVKGVLGGLAIAEVARGAFNVARDSIREGRESIKVGRQTQAVLKSTGGIANVSAKQIGGYADALSRKTGVDDEAIQSGENMLLTFKGVRNEVGKGNDIFKQASATALDMSKATGQDLVKSNLQLGKALNDPIKGMSALRRVGVTFDDQQVKQITHMQKHHDILGAQKIILHELSGEFGGSAAAQASASDKFQVAWGNAEEALGKLLIPMLDKALRVGTKLANWAIDDLVPKLSKAAGGVRKFLTPAIDAIDSLRNAMSGGTVGGDSWLSTSVGLMQNVGTVAKRTQSDVSGIGSAFARFWHVVRPILVAIGTAIISTVREHMPELRQIWGSIQSIIHSAMQIVKRIVELTTKAISWIWSHFGHNIIAVLKAVLGTVIGVLSGAFKIIAGLFKLISAVLRGDWRGAWNAIKDILRGAWQVIHSVLKGALGVLKATTWAAFKWIIGKMGDFSDWLSRGFHRGVSRAIDGIGELFNRLKRQTAEPINFAINTVYNNGLRKALNLIPGVNLGAASPIHWGGAGAANAARAGRASSFAAGGVLPGYTPGRDVHRFYSPTGGQLELSGGEAIMRPEFTKAVGGKAGIEALNRAVRHAAGGVFWPTNTRRLSNNYAGHSGVDIAAGMGAPIWAAQPGRISYTGWGRGFGQAIFERLANGLEVVYGHTSQLLSRVGQLVGAGNLIGRVGATGHASGPHLHVELGTHSFGTPANRGDTLNWLHGANFRGGGGGSFASLFDPSHVRDLISNVVGRIHNMGARGMPGIARKGAMAGVTGARNYVTRKARELASAGLNTLGAGWNTLKGAFGSGPQSVGHRMMLAAGWGENQWGPLLRLWNRESGWRVHARNPSSGAYGIPQALPASKLATAGGDWRNSAETQIRWGLGYIRGRYGSPANAWSHEVMHNWYKQGGVLPQFSKGAYIRGGRGGVVARIGEGRNDEIVLPVQKGRGGGGQRLDLTLNLTSELAVVFEDLLNDDRAAQGTIGRMVRR